MSAEHTIHPCGNAKSQQKALPTLGKLQDNGTERPKTIILKEGHLGTSLVVQWLRLQAPNTEGLRSVPGQGTRSFMAQHRCCSYVPQLKIPWRRPWQPTPVFLPGESSWTEEPGGLSPWGHKDSNRTERLSAQHTCSKTLCIKKHSVPQTHFEHDPQFQPNISPVGMAGLSSLHLEP